MAKLVARLGDPGSHGGAIITSAAKTSAESKRIARIGDIYDCPRHGPNPIVSGAGTRTVEGAKVALDGSLTECGAVIQATATATYTE